MSQPEHDDDIEYVSKSQMKRDMTALQDLGEALIPLEPKVLQTLDLPERLYNALIEAKRLKANGAIARQKQYIGKLMRDVDPAPIQALLDARAGVSDRHNAWLHQLERARERLIGDAKTVEAFVEQHPGLDIQRLRQLIRAAQKERADAAAGKQVPPKAFRELFQLLKEIIPEPPLVPDTEETDD
ncbi:ribosome biogenesis factor YjgA [Chitinolyticbacter meiyuanensis]|uniref:ribosome biogenesis factor YjgA n=1 Tax=Chitinolyticbacter meiyuanensis TaxID=682798 RepID=UPI0011E595F7|nr:ribosome biogenesis factor YjgA [Chitinolyticbacter meiyuanensis]